MKKPNFEHGKTCAYTICKNEIKNIDTWYYYASTSFDYYCILDTGSTDGTWERLQELAEKDFNNFVKTACDFIKFHTQFDKKYDEVLRELTNIYLHYKDCPVENKLLIESVISGRSI